MRERLSRLPNSLLLGIALVLFVAAGVVATVPFDVWGTDGASVECGPPVFELLVPGHDESVLPIDGCSEGARFRVVLAVVAALTAFVVAMSARQIRKRRYEKRIYEWEDAPEPR